MINQYSNRYSPELEITLPSEARYVKRVDTENPYITALPPIRTQKELQNDCMLSPGMPTQDEINNMPREDKIAVIQKLEDTRLYLPYYREIEEAVDNALTRSYKRRASMKSDRPYAHYFYQDTKTETYQHSEIKGLGNAPVGFTVLGESGCGKSTGVNCVLAKYPLYIIHNPGTLQQHVQIPVIAVEMPRNSNFHGLYQAIGKRIDKILNNNSNVYASELGRKGDSLEVKYRKLCQLIEIFNIGLLVIDEIEHINKSRVSEGTLETFLSLANETGIAVGVIGNEEAFEKLFTTPRVTRRLGKLINADTYCSDVKLVHFILNMLYSYLPYQVKLTNECLDAYFKESDGIIHYIVQLFVGASVEFIKGKQITPELISHVAKKIFTAKKCFEENTVETTIKNSNKTSMEDVRKMLQTAMPGEKSDFKLPEGNRIREITDSIKSAIHVFCANKYSDADIETAIRNVINDTDSQETILQAVLKELTAKETARLKQAEKKKQNEEAVEHLQEIKDRAVRNKNV